MTIRPALSTLLVLVAVAAAPASATAKKLAAPKSASPAADATVQSVPSFTWGKVKGADRYEFQLAADANFGSIVGGRGTGSFTTKNLAGTLTKSIPDGSYWWRVRAITAGGKAGRWSERRTLTKSWAPAPQLIAPGDDAAIAFPSEPIILRWSPVPRAYKYRLYLATDSSLGSLVLGKDPIELSGTVFSPDGALPGGRYYWAVEAVDASGHRGPRSATGTFTRTWPSVTTTAFADLVSDARMTEPELSWNPIPGAVGYQVEINHSEDFAIGSRVCCDAADTGLTDGLVYGTSLAPKRILPDNVYHWRVRGIDADGNAGQWNRGPGVFDAFYASGADTVNLRLRDNAGDLAVGALTSAPVISWDPVPGAASYGVQVTPVEGGACNWSTNSLAEYWNVETTSTAFTFLAPTRNGAVPVETNGLTVATDNGKALVDGHSYCVRVHAKRGGGKVLGDPAQLGGVGATAFTYDQYVPAAPPSGALLATDGHYRAPRTGAITPRVPLLTWSRVEGAHAYYVVVSKNAGFTNVVDVALVNNPAYVPRMRTYADDNTPYYYAILPAKQADGEEVTSAPSQNAPQSFDKRSLAPVLLTPAAGAVVTEQPVFRWTSGDAAVATPEGAKEYRLQVAQDPSFVNPLDDVTTAATSYTSARSYPADADLYWRVRANDANGVGLAWSQVGTFRRRLTAPALTADNPAGGATIPALRWSPVQGASSYTLLVDYTNGSRKDYTLRSTVATPLVWAGPGVWRWQVRANFPTGSGEVASAFTDPFTYVRRIPAPGGVHAFNRGGRVLLSWEASPATGIKEYRVEFSDTDSFEQVGQVVTTQNLSVAPDLSRAPFIAGGRIYWRISAIDEVGNVGGSAAGRLVTARRMTASAGGSLVKRVRSPFQVTVVNAAGRPVRKVKVRLRGRPVRPVARRTNKRGIAKFSVRPRRAGSILVRATRNGYAPVTLRVRVG